MLAAVAVFTAASALCGVASSLGELVAFRILQGAGGGMLAPVGMAMLYRAFPPEERIRAAAILTVPTTLAPALGPVLGGLLVTGLSWRWVFYVNVPIGAAAFAFGAIFLAQPAQARPGRFDLAGFLLSGLGLGLLMYGVSEGPDLGWHRAQVLATIARRRGQHDSRTRRREGRQVASGAGSSGLTGRRYRPARSERAARCACGPPARRSADQARR